MGTFLQFDPAKNNMQTDAVYSASSFRAQGAQTGIASSSAFNKLIYQLSTMTTALADMMVAKGYTIDDASLTTLTTQLENIMTLADMSSYASKTDLDSYIAKAAVVIKTSSYIILTTDMYKTLEANSSGTLTFTLPAYTTVANGAWIKIKNVGTGVLTLSGLIDGAASKDLNQYEEITVYSDGVSWRGKVIASTSALSFDASLTENGYQKLPSGLIIQWGKVTDPIGVGASRNIDFPTPFLNYCLNVQVTGMNINSYGGSAHPRVHNDSITLSSFSVDVLGSYSWDLGAGSPLGGLLWQAIGY